jgi:hypothetical protein
MAIIPDRRRYGDGAGHPVAAASVGAVAGSASIRSHNWSNARWHAARVLARTMYTTSLMTAV